jgi:tRNA A-37 threonylcarbamoyl transferase component Bud32
MVAQEIKDIIIHDLVNEIPELSEGFSLSQYKSKKNFVYDLVFKIRPRNFPKQIILKVFQTENADYEYNIYQKLAPQNIPIPKVLLFKKPYLILEKINGINLCDLVNNNLINMVKLDDLNPTTLDMILISIKKLASWLAQLHRQNIIKRKKSFEIIVLNKGDTRLRDFIMNFYNENLYGFDFEESYEGNYLDDLAWICCALLDTDPGIFEMFEPKHKTELINIFLKEYFRINNDFHFSFNYFAERLIGDLNIVIERRSLELGPVNKDSIIKSILKDY